jgi:hypothetical protein
VEEGIDSPTENYIPYYREDGSEEEVAIEELPRKVQGLHDGRAE